MKIFAYLDPGTGSLILQATIGVVVGAGIFFRDGIKKLFLLITGRSKKSKEEPSNKPKGEPKD